MEDGFHSRQKYQRYSRVAPPTPPISACSTRGTRLYRQRLQSRTRSQPSNTITKGRRSLTSSEHATFALLGGGISLHSSSTCNQTSGMPTKLNISFLGGGHRAPKVRLPVLRPMSLVGVQNLLSIDIPRALCLDFHLKPPTANLKDNSSPFPSDEPFRCHSPCLSRAIAPSNQDELPTCGRHVSLGHANCLSF